MKHFHCDHCTSTVFFDNHHCVACGSALAFVPVEGVMGSFAIDADGVWERQGGSSPGVFDWRPCANRDTAFACNWAVKTADPCPSCWSCRLTRLDLSAPIQGHETRWGAIEHAKRWLLSTLLTLHVPYGAKDSHLDADGLEFIWQLPVGLQPVLTGHVNGTVTVNLQEADDDHREANRVAFGEPLRTLLGHLRHEVSHHLYQRFLLNGDAFFELGEEFTALFGDGNADYQVAMGRYYQLGPAANWQMNYISAYASMHPWEDWAETCAHYLLIVDGLETAAAWGLQLQAEPGADALTPQTVLKLPIETLVLNQWLPVSRFLNAMSRSIGLRDSYPFVMPYAVVLKLGFVQRVLQRAARQPA